MARELGVSWHTVMDAVAEIGEPLVDDPARVGDVAMLGVDETTWLAARRHHRTRFATGLVDLTRRRIIDVIPGNAAGDLGRWLDAQPAPWCHGIAVVATDLAESYRRALDGRLEAALGRRDSPTVPGASSRSATNGTTSRPRPRAPVSGSFRGSPHDDRRLAPPLHRVALGGCSVAARHREPVPLLEFLPAIDQRIEDGANRVGVLGLARV